MHHVLVHDERLPNRTCDYCGKSFYSDTAKKYCSRDCLLDSDSYSKENHPNWKGGKEAAECRICGREFEYYPSEKPGIYCGNCVENEAWRETPRVTGEDNPRWSGGKIEACCEVCGTTVRRHRSALQNKTILCSRECQAAWLSESYTGDGHPNWKGGGNEAYGKGWRRAKLKTLERDDDTCVLCGSTKDDLGRNPDVHHIVPVRSFIEAPIADKTDAHAPKNLVTLCVACHRRADFGTPSKAELKRLVDEPS
ncbi:MAG: HNH endonuclease [Halobacteriales archaeon]